MSLKFKSQSTIKDLKFLKTINEANIVKLIVYELQHNKQFFFYFMSKLKIDSSNLKYKNCEISVFEDSSETEIIDGQDITVRGENDLVITYYDEDNKECAVLVEAKIDAQKQPAQPERYLARCKHYVKPNYLTGRPLYRKCDNILICPKIYYYSQDHNTLYDNCVFFEDIMEEYYKGSAAEYNDGEAKISFLKKSLQRIKYDNAVSLGWRAYLEYVKKHYPDTYDKLSADTIYFRGEDTGAYYINDEKQRTIKYSISNGKEETAAFAISCHFRSGIYAIIFENINTAIYDNLQSVMTQALNDLKIEATIRHGKQEKKDFRILCVIEGPKFSFDDIYQIDDANIDVQNASPSEIKNAKVSLKREAVPLVEENIMIVRKLHSVGYQMSLEQIKDIYSKNK